MLSTELLCFTALGHRRVGYLRADRAQTDHAQLLALDLMSGKCLLALLHGLGDVGVILILLAPPDAAHDIPGG